MSELTNEQVALQAAVASYGTLSGSYLNDSNYINRANTFLKWLNEKDEA